MTTWKKLIEDELKRQGESWSDIIFCTLSYPELEIEFDGGFGIEEGKPFTLWTDNRVYFPTTYDGAEDVASVARNPENVPTYHIGG